MKINNLNYRDIIILGFMTFALFVGAGNIIFPPMIGFQAGNKVWLAASGFLITAVCLPMLTVIALAKVNGNLNHLSYSLGKKTGLILAIICHLAVGPLFAIPRTTAVSFDAGIKFLIGDNELNLLIYSLIYFTIVTCISLYPNYLLDTVGKFLAPLKTIILFMLAMSALIYPVNNVNNTNREIVATEIYKKSAFASGFIGGYLTMDTLGAMVFGIIIINTIKSKGITNIKMLVRYNTWVCLIAALGLTILYLALFYLGSNSTPLISGASINGAKILHSYVQYTFNNNGSFLLAVLIFISCLVTSVGLICSCANFFKKYSSISYRSLVLIISIFSTIFSNLGLNYLIKITIPVMMAIYPPCIILIILSFTRLWWNNSSRVINPVVYASLFFGIFDSIKSSVFYKFMPNYIQYYISYLPFSDYGLIWLIPTLFTLLIATILDFKNNKS